MTTSSRKFWKAAPVFVRGADDSPDPLLVYVLDSLQDLRGSTVVSALLCVLVNVAAFAMTDDLEVFVAEMVANLGVSAGRLRLLDRWRLLRRRPLKARDVARWDRHYLIGSTLFSLLIGLVAYHLAAHRDAPGAFSLAVAMCTGFSISFATGAAGRPLTAAAQIAALTGPLIFAFLTLQMPLGGLWAAMTAVLDGGALLIVGFTRARILGLYRANEENRRLAACRTEFRVGRGRWSIDA